MSLIKAFRRFGRQHLPPEVARAFEELQSAIEDVLAPLRQVPLLDGVLLDVTVDTNPVDVAHGLGRAWRGWIVVQKNGSFNTWTNPSPDETRFIRFDSSTSGSAFTLRVWVF